MSKGPYDGFPYEWWYGTIFMWLRDCLCVYVDDFDGLNDFSLCLQGRIRVGFTEVRGNIKATDVWNSIPSNRTECRCGLTFHPGHTLTSIARFSMTFETYVSYIVHMYLRYILTLLFAVFSKLLILLRSSQWSQNSPSSALWNSYLFPKRKYTSLLQARPRLKNTKRGYHQKMYDDTTFSRLQREKKPFDDMTGHRTGWSLAVFPGLPLTSTTANACCSCTRLVCWVEFRILDTGSRGEVDGSGCPTVGGNRMLKQASHANERTNDYEWRCVWRKKGFTSASENFRGHTTFNCPASRNGKVPFSFCFRLNFLALMHCHPLFFAFWATMY